MRRSLVLVLLVELLGACARGAAADLGGVEDDVPTEPADEAGLTLPPRSDSGAQNVQDANAASDAALDAAVDAKVDAGADAGLPSSIQNGLLFHMSFDGAAPVDVTGNHPASSITNTTFVAAPDRFGHPGGAARFNATPQTLVQVGPPNSLPIGNAPRTLAAWARPRIAAPSSTTNSNVFLHWGIDDCTSKMFGLGNRLDHGFGWTGCVDIDSTLAVPVASWTFLALTYTGGTLTLWVNTTKVSQGGVTLATPASSPLAIGGERKTYGQGFVSYFDGDLDDVRVWSRALDDTELAALAAEK